MKMSYCLEAHNFLINLMLFLIMLIINLMLSD